MGDEETRALIRAGQAAERLARAAEGVERVLRERERAARYQQLTGPIDTYVEEYMSAVDSNPYNDAPTARGDEGRER